jgi:hypothetical protein
VNRQQAFAHRARVYHELDVQLQSRTRFFAAAALINSVLADLFRFIRVQSLQEAYGLLSDAGAVLETANVVWARELAQSARVDPEADQNFVRREQRLLQSFIESTDSANGCSRALVRADLNRLLNGRHWSLIGAPCIGQSRRFVRILTSVRSGLGSHFDFNLESHRIELGLAIVRDVRAQGPLSPPVAPTI